MPITTIKFLTAKPLLTSLQFIGLFRDKALGSELSLLFCNQFLSNSKQILPELERLIINPDDQQNQYNLAKIAVINISSQPEILQSASLIEQLATAIHSSNAVLLTRGGSQGSACILGAFSRFIFFDPSTKELCYAHNNDHFLEYLCNKKSITSDMINLVQVAHEVVPATEKEMTTFSADYSKPRIFATFNFGKKRAEELKEEYLSCDGLF